MTPLALLSMVFLATFGLSNLILSAGVALIWHAGLQRHIGRANDLLWLRVLPAAAGLFLALTVVLPAFIACEPVLRREPVGPLVVALAALALATLLHGFGRGLRVCLATRSLLRCMLPMERCKVESGQEMHLIDVAEPIVGVIGAWRPRIVAARCLLTACNPEELRQVMAHEAAHILNTDNLKLLLMVASPDVLAWTSFGAALKKRWNAAAELEADWRATDGDPRKGVVLASAVLKIARLSSRAEPPRLALSMSAASNCLEGRVRQLLAPPAKLPATLITNLTWYGLAAAVLAIPFYAWIHEVVELLVKFGR